MTLLLRILRPLILLSLGVAAVPTCTCEFYWLLADVNSKGDVKRSGLDVQTFDASWSVRNFKGTQFGTEFDDGADLDTTPSLSTGLKDKRICFRGKNKVGFGGGQIHGPYAYERFSYGVTVGFDDKVNELAGAYLDAQYNPPGDGTLIFKQLKATYYDELTADGPGLPGIRVCALDSTAINDGPGSGIVGAMDFPLAAEVELRLEWTLTQVIYKARVPVQAADGGPDIGEPWECIAIIECPNPIAQIHLSAGGFGLAKGNRVYLDGFVLVNEQFGNVGPADGGDGLWIPGLERSLANDLGAVYFCLEESKQILLDAETLEDVECAKDGIVGAQLILASNLFSIESAFFSDLFTIGEGKLAMRATKAAYKRAFRTAKSLCNLIESNNFNAKKIKAACNAVSFIQGRSLVAVSNLFGGRYRNPKQLGRMLSLLPERDVTIDFVP